MVVCIVSHDAGGAEIISSYISQKNMNCSYVLDGPAVKIFEQKLGHIFVEPLEKCIKGADWLLCGSGKGSDLELQAIEMARKLGKQSSVFLDHWVNYRERFLFEDELRLPDEVWVGDKLAENLAKNILPEVKIKYVANPYFTELKQKITAIAKPHANDQLRLKILFVTASLREHGIRDYDNERHFGYTEEEALHYFLSNLKIFDLPIECIVIRPHPSEAQDKYDWVKDDYRLPIITGGRRTLLEEVVECDVVVGFDSMAMVVGLLAGKRVISCIPPGGDVCTLPQPEIEHLHELIV